MEHLNGLVTSKIVTSLYTFLLGLGFSFLVSFCFCFILRDKVKCLVGFVNNMS